MTAPQDFGRVAVLMGGYSAERPISLKTGEAVTAGLQRSGVDAHAVDVGTQSPVALAGAGYDRAFIALHGRGGEDGTMQGFLEILGLPYTGSGVLGSAVGMDKLICKRLWESEGLPTPAGIVLGPDSDPERVLAELGSPVMVKPAREGSSLGASRVTRPEGLRPAYEQAAALDDVVLAEAWVTGAEYTAAILGDRVLPLIHLATPHGFYDYEAKYEAESTQFECPAGLTAADEARFAELCRRAFTSVGAGGWGRVDFILDEQGEPQLLEVNTVPGLTDHSLVPMAGQAAGIGFDELTVRILETSLEVSR